MPALLPLDGLEDFAAKDPAAEALERERQELREKRILQARIQR